MRLEYELLEVRPATRGMVAACTHPKHYTATLGTQELYLSQAVHLICSRFSMFMFPVCQHSLVPYCSLTLGEFCLLI